MTVKQAIERMEGILSNHKYPQIRGKLILRDDYNNIVGKCAYGEMACGTGIHVPEDNYTLTLYEQIGTAVGFPSWLVSGFILPTFSVTEGFYQPFTHTGDDMWSGDSIMNWIVRLNDNGFTYPEIIEFLKTTFDGVED